jgi:hypothetical protein
MPKPPKDVARGEADELLRIHRLHVGVYNRVAAKLGVHASLVSRVAKGTRRSETVLQALIEELSSIQPRRSSRRQP